MEVNEIWGERKEMVKISLPNANEVLKRGLRFFLGGNYEWLPEYDEIAKWLTDNKGRGLLFYGSNGRGKTVVCQKVIPAIFTYYLKVDYNQYDAIDLGDTFRNEIGNIELMWNEKPLLIDDIGTESVINDYGEKHDLVSELIDRAEKTKRLLILTTNLTPSEIGERYGLRTLDRLRSIVKSVKSIGDSLRR